MTLPATENLLLDQQGPFLHITLNRPESRNAMSLAMVDELLAVFEAIETRNDIRAIVLRGTNGHFSAGGDIKDMASARARAAEGDTDAFLTFNRRFGTMITTANRLPQVVVAVVEGAVLGGGFGLVCIADVALAADTARFGLPETSLGVVPAQIAPFVVQRVGLSQARRLALTGAQFDGREAARLGIVHQSFPADELDEALEKILASIRRCAPHASRVTKQLLLRVGKQELESLLDDAARHFSDAVTSEEGAEGTLAFVQKRLPGWAQS